jgi:hypothetical protein
LGPTSNAIPANPRTKPASTRDAGREPPGRNQSTKTIHNDTVATSSAAIPEGMIFSAQLTVPLPHRSSRTPVTIAVRHWSQGRLFSAHTPEYGVKHQTH